MVPRRQEYDLKPIAELLAHGFTFAAIAEIEDLSIRKVQTRVRAIRRFLQDRDNDLVWRDCSPVECGRSYIGESVHPLTRGDRAIAIAERERS